MDDILRYIYEKEDVEFRTRRGMFDNQKDITEKMRAILIDWLVDVHKKFRLRMETLFHCCQILDKYLISNNISR